MDDLTRWQKVKSRLFYLFPHHWVSRAAFFLGRLNTMLAAYPIGFFIRRFGVDMSEAEHESPASYPSFNAFFARKLKPGAREICDNHRALASPCDGTVMQIGDCADGAIVQAKGREYSVSSLLGVRNSSVFNNGKFCTFYLSPRDYHRVHMPLAGELEAMIHVPGRLFSVAPYALQAIDGLYAKNERVVCLFKTDFGKMALVMIGAVNVAAIETVWAGLVTPRSRSVVHYNYAGYEPVKLGRGDECAHFNIGSSVVLLLENGGFQWNPLYCPGEAVKMGCELATLPALPTPPAPPAA